MSPNLTGDQPRARDPGHDKLTYEESCRGRENMPKNGDSRPLLFRCPDPLARRQGTLPEAPRRPRRLAPRCQRNLFDRVIGQLHHCFQQRRRYGEALAFPAPSHEVSTVAAQPGTSTAPEAVLRERSWSGGAPPPATPPATPASARLSAANAPTSAAKRHLLGRLASPCGVIKNPASLLR